MDQNIKIFLSRKCFSKYLPLLKRHNGRDGVSNHQPHECLLNRSFMRRSKKTSKLRVTGLCAGNSPETGEFPAQMSSNTENVAIWWRHHATIFPGFNMFIKWNNRDQVMHMTVNKLGNHWLSPESIGTQLSDIVIKINEFHKGFYSKIVWKCVKVSSAIILYLSLNVLILLYHFPRTTRTSRAKRSLWSYGFSRIPWSNWGSRT